MRVTQDGQGDLHTRRGCEERVEDRALTHGFIWVFIQSGACYASERVFLERFLYDVVHGCSFSWLKWWCSVITRGVGSLWYKPFKNFNHCD